MTIQTMPSLGAPLGGPALTESGRSGVSWGAVLAGTVVASAVTVMLMALGTAIGFGAVSPFAAGSNPSMKSFSVYAAIWLIVVQWVSSAFGGFLTGRLRTKWTELHTHEVFFRDTANGFVTWALSSLVVVGLLSFGGAQLVSGAARMGGQAVQGAAQGASQGMSQGASSGTINPRDTVVDTLLRPSQPAAQATPAETRGEVTRILFGSTDGTIAPEDRAYLVQLVGTRTGLTQPDAERRVDDAIAKEQAALDRAKQAANAARKATAAFMLYSFVSMLIGAFIACVAAALGGHERDTY